MKMSAAKVLMLCVVSACFVSTQQQVPGGEQIADPNDQENLNLLTKVVINNILESNGEVKKILKVTSSKVQVVAGTKHTMEFTAEGVNSKKQFHCNTVFVDAPWLSPNPNILSFTCKPDQ